MNRNFVPSMPHRLTREERRRPYKRTQCFSLNHWNCWVSCFFLQKGIDSESWGLSYKGFIWHNGRSRKYSEPFYERNTVIGVLLDLSAGTLTFFRNGVNLGVAFSGLEQVKRETSLHRVCWSTGCRLYVGTYKCFWKFLFLAGQQGSVSSGEFYCPWNWASAGFEKPKNVLSTGTVYTHHHTVPFTL